MDREHARLARPPRPSDADSVADRLQQLTTDEVERVLERAIELQAHAPDGGAPATLTTEMLERIADELEIDRAHLRTALAEELVRLQTEEPDLVARLLAPDRVSAQRVVTGSAEPIREALDLWMGAHEGMRKRAENPSKTTWEKDRSLISAARMKLRMARGSGVLRAAGDVTTAVRPVSGDQQLVTVEADTSNLRRLAGALLFVAGAAGVVVAGAGGAADANGFGLDNLVLGATTGLVLGGGVWLGIRMWVNKLRRAVTRVAEAVASPHLIERAETLPGMIRKLFGLGATGRSSRPPR